MERKTGRIEQRREVDIGAKISRKSSEACEGEESKAEEHPPSNYREK